MTATPEAVVVVTTRDRSESLDRCLSALRADSSEVSREIVVVDNGSSDDTAEVVSSHALADSTRVRRVWEPNPGQCRARNTGIARSGAPLILLADDDVTVHDGWSDALAAALSAPEVVAVGGRVLPAWSGTVPDWLDGQRRMNVGLEDYGSVSFSCTADRLPFGANLAFRRTVLAPFRGPFDERLGHRGRVAMGFDEWHLLIQLLRTGEVRYESSAVVDHHVSASRMSYESVRRRMWQSGFGHARSARLLGEPQPPWPRVAARTARLAREAASQRRQHPSPGTPVSGEAAAQDFYAHFWWGVHTEMLTGRLPWLADLLAERMLGRG